MKYQDLKSLAKDTSLSVFTIRKLIKLGLPHYRFGRKILVSPVEFDTWFKERFRISQEPNDAVVDRMVQEALAKLV
jgi:hypothetical protein